MNLLHLVLDDHNEIKIFKHYTLGGQILLRYGQVLLSYIIALECCIFLCNLF